MILTWCNTSRNLRGKKCSSRVNSMDSVFPTWEISLIKKITLILPIFFILLLGTGLLSKRPRGKFSYVWNEFCLPHQAVQSRALLKTLWTKMWLQNITVYFLLIATEFLWWSDPCPYLIFERARQQKAGSYISNIKTLRQREFIVLLLQFSFFQRWLVL